MKSSLKKTNLNHVHSKYKNDDMFVYVYII